MIKYIRISPDKQCIEHSDWETLGLHFQSNSINGDKYVIVTGVESSIDIWNARVKGVEITESVFIDTVKVSEKDGLGNEIKELESELLSKKDRYIELGGNVSS